MKKVIVIAGHNDKDPGASGNGYREADLTKEFRSLLSTAIGIYQSDFGLNLKIVNDDDSLNLNRVINWVNGLPFGEERLIIDIHFNAFNTHANGTETIIPDNYCVNELSLGKKIAATMASAMGIFNRGCKQEKRTARKKLAIMRPKGINILLEICFIDNKKDIEAYHANKNELARRIAKDILSHKYV